MKYIKVLPLAVLTLLAVVTACSNETKEEILDAKEPLRVTLGEISRSPSVIESTTLPNNSQYVVAVCRQKSEWSIVDYKNGTSSLRTPILLGKELKQISAFYPESIFDLEDWEYYNGTAFHFTIPEVTDKQEDILYGMSIQDVNESQPEARINMKHALAHITLNITKDDSDDEKELLLYAYIDNVCQKGFILSEENRVMGFEDEHMSITSNYIKRELDNNSIVVDFLCIPSNNPKLRLNIDGREDITADFPASFTEGNHYTYNVIVNRTSKLIVTEVQIEEWKLNGNYDLDESKLEPVIIILK